MDNTPKLQVRLVGRDGRRRYDLASRDQLCWFPRRTEPVRQIISIEN
jgi:hypothetical protein